jgi:phosphoglycerate dehydrogenase-like enzyme
MPKPAQIVTVCHLPTVQWMFDAIEPRLASAGYEVVPYRTEAAFRADATALATADVLLAAGQLPCSRALMASAPRLRAIICPYSGTEGFDIPAATDLGILIANGQTTENSDGMAEATILLILASLYDLHGSEAVLRGTIPRPAHSRAFMLRDKTVGLIGYGRIARSMTVRLESWGVQLQAWSRRIDPDVSPAVAWVGLDDLLRTSDVICVLLGLNDGTRGLLDASRLGSMKPGVVLVNTARGGIIDEAALVELARQRPAMRIALDTFATEPLPMASPLRDLPNTILTPHMLGHTVEGHAVLPGVAVEAITRILAGKPPRYVRNADAIPEWRRRWVSDAPGP